MSDVPTTLFDDVNNSGVDSIVRQATAAIRTERDDWREVAKRERRLNRMREELDREIDREARDGERHLRAI